MASSRLCQVRSESVDLWPCLSLCGSPIGPRAAYIRLGALLPFYLHECSHHVEACCSRNRKSRSSCWGYGFLVLLRAAVIGRQATGARQEPSF